MKRSEINSILRESIDFFKRENFNLPPFAWTRPNEWKAMRERAQGIIEARLGWDVTDFNLGDFVKTGILLFTLRNGAPNEGLGGEERPSLKTSLKTYCEKIIHMREGQTCPTHYHRSKMEDIINRSGKTLCFTLHMAGEDGRSYSEEGFTISRDGVETPCEAGEIIKLNPGESITLPPYLYHSFWAEGGDVLVGEVSRVNDDETDNFFYVHIPRFTEIEEDEEPLYLLCHELKRFLD
ncbi:MAG: D-lyxose/D-mannose family sugar isomerase [Deltaproteobacteria bacterium]|uniref:D-lyxose ketol-isomerase n=1 Tax=Candidatus Zymogenus saltonus TaxID=2844893 RepID=A0A9D8PPY7_9DELT|nr:D-lyxose/D-mannose family sugar isomerase [Candidatus Zymogenus saltonus]